MCVENRKYARFTAKSNLQVSIQADGSGLTVRGIALNVSQGGAYVLAESIPFETAFIRFDPPNKKSILKKCSRIDPHRKGAQGMAVEFSSLLAAEELELLMESVPDHMPV